MQIIPHIILMLEGFSTFLDEVCDADCDNSSPIGHWTREDIKCIAADEACFPSLKQLRQLCPQTLQFLNCKSRALEDCEELTAVPNLNLSMDTKHSMIIENLVRDICNENSAFHKDYVSILSCYMRVYFNMTDYCWDMYTETKQDFIKYLDLTDKRIPDEIKCLMMGYQEACLAQSFLLSCGEIAQRIFVRTLRDFQGCFAHYTEDCLTVCEEFNPLEEWEDVGYAPSLHMLKTLCPKTLDFLDCRMKEMQDCLEQNFEELTVSTNLSVASFSRVIVATDNLIRQVCDENSSFHKDYVKNIDCYKAYFYVIKQFCKRDVSRIENLFLGTLEVSPKEDTSCKVKLFSGSYELACTSDLVGRACGPTAKRLHSTASLMFKHIFLVDCPRVNQDWRKEYLNFLLGNKRREFEEIYNEFF